MVRKSIRSERDSSEEQLAESLMSGWTAIKNPRAAPVGGVADLQDNLRKAGVDIVTMPIPR